MPTVPPEQPRPAPGQAHEARAMAESFGVDPERYDRARPAYPNALVQRIIAAGPGRVVLDVGCGTGVEARQFQAAGCTVLGVDPDPRMVEFARKSGVTAEVATTGALTQLAPAALAEVLDAVGAAIDEIGGGFTMPYSTFAATATRIGA